MFAIKQSLKASVVSWQLPLFAALSVLSGACALGQVTQTCSDPKPPDQACTAVRPVGEINGCACFICYSGDNREQTVCSKDQKTKDDLSAKPKK